MRIWLKKMACVHVRCMHLVGTAAAAAAAAAPIPTEYGIKSNIKTIFTHKEEKCVCVRASRDVA